MISLQSVVMNEGMQRRGGLRSEQARLKISDAIGPGQIMVPSDASQNVSVHERVRSQAIPMVAPAAGSSVTLAAHIQYRFEIGNLLVTTWTRIALVSSRDLS
jgi:hypothetical protein